MNDYFHLIKKQFNKTITQPEEHMLKEWVDSHPNNRRLYTYYYATLRLFRIKQNEKRFASRVIPAYNRMEQRTRGNDFISRKRKPYRWMAYAATLLLAFGVGYFINQSNSEQWSTAMQSIEIAYGSKSNVTLPDGTQVWLNSGSKLEYPVNFGQTNRNIKLKGEAYFEVAKNKKIPFNVSSGKIAIHVLGTKFNMKAYPEDEKARITLVEGSLEVEDSQSPNANILLKPNQQAVINRHNEKIQIREVIASNYVMWTTSDSKSAELTQTSSDRVSASVSIPQIAIRNILFFDEEPLGQIAKDLERAFNVNIEIKDKSLQNKHFYGDFRNEETITDILKIIAEKNDLYYTIKGDTIQIVKREKRGLK